MPIVAGTYPDLRPGRIGGAAAAAIAATPPPQVALWPFMLRVSGLNTTHILVSRQFPGAAILDKLHFTIQHASGNPLTSVQLYVASDDGGAGINQAGIITPTGTPIYQSPSIGRSDGFAAPSGAGRVFSWEEPTIWHFELSLGVPVTLSSFYLKLRLTMNTVTAITITGQLRMLLGLTPGELGNVW